MGAPILIPGDMLDVLPQLPADSFDAAISDPPYHLASIVSRFGKAGSVPPKAGTVYARSSAGFMGQTWDGGDIAMRAETWQAVFRVLKPGAHLIAFGGSRTHHRIWTAIEDAGFEIRDTLFWVFGQGFPKSHPAGDGRGTALKPASEPIVLARKPLIGTVLENLIRHGTGALRIDACRVGGGRWPATVLHDGSAEVIAAFPGGAQTHQVFFEDEPECAARFFYAAKASKEDRGPGNNHATVKPLNLMRYLCRLVTQPGGIVLDPFMGSGSTGKAALLEGFEFIGIEREPAYVEIAATRMKRWIKP